MQNNDLNMKKRYLFEDFSKGRSVQYVNFVKWHISASDLFYSSHTFYSKSNSHHYYCITYYKMLSYCRETMQFSMLFEKLV